MMGKFTVWIVLAGVAWLGWTLWRIGRRRAESAASPPPAGSDSARREAQGTGAVSDEAPPEPMLSCAHCGLYLPARDAVAGARDASYCSTAHRDLTEQAPRGPSASR